MAAVDLDGDGDRDLAVADQNTDLLTILRNDGTGRFFEPASSPVAVGGLPTSVVAGDFDGDFDQDLAVANWTTNDVAILMNSGAGKFHERASSPELVGENPNSVVAADLDGDTDIDLATANASSNDVTVLANRGSGNFRPVATSPEVVGATPREVTAADLDGDGDQDLAVANEDDDNVTILRNDGSANFSRPASSPRPVGNAPNYVTAVDVDGDNDNDLAVANTIGNTVTILKNKGSAAFFEPASSPEAVGSVPEEVTAADFDLDGDQDLAVANALSNNVTVLRNLGWGNYSQPASSPEVVGTFPAALKAADLDGDLDADLAVANIVTDNVTILRNR